MERSFSIIPQPSTLHTKDVMVDTMVALDKDNVMTMEFDTPFTIKNHQTGDDAVCIMRSLSDHYVVIIDKESSDSYDKLHGEYTAMVKARRAAGGVIPTIEAAPFHDMPFPRMSKMLKVFRIGKGDILMTRKMVGEALGTTEYVIATMA